MSAAKDLPILAAIALLLVGGVYAVGVQNLPGLGDFQTPDYIDSNPEPDTELFKVSSQVTVGSTATGDTFARGFTCQVQKDGFNLNIADSSSLAIGGANNVKVDLTVVNEDSGKKYVDRTYFLGEIGAGQSVSVDTSFGNAREGSYEFRYVVNYDPEIWDDRTRIERTFNCEVTA